MKKVKILYDQMCELLRHSKSNLSLAEEGGAQLEEKDENVDMSIDIVTAQCPKGTVVWKCPESPGSIFASRYAKICDYIIFIPLKQKIKVVFVELKATLNEKNIGQAKRQLFQTTTLLSYIYSGLRIHCNFSKICTEKHYIMFFEENKLRFDKECTRYDDRELLSVKKCDITIMLFPSPREISVGKIIKICESNT